jgi:hypothetical protein
VPETVVIISDRQLLNEFKTKAATKFSVQEVSKGLVLQDKAGRRITIKENNTKGRQRYAKMEDLPEIYGRLETLFFYYLQYEKNRFMKELFQILLDDEEIMVDLSLGFIIDGKQFAFAMQHIVTRSDEVENESGVSFYSDREWIKNEVCFAIVKYDFDAFKLFHGELRLSKPLELTIRSGKKFNDIAHYYGITPGFAISERLRRLLVEEGVTGWSTYDLHIAGCDLLYHGFICTGKCAPIRRPATNDEILGYPITGWDGSDFFCAGDWGTLFFTQKVKDLYEKHDIRRVEIVDTRDIKWY